MTVSIIIPTYNERPTIRELLSRVMASGLTAEQILVVDDGSTDGTSDELQSLPPEMPVTLLRHERNRGKGAAIATALAQATGDVVVIQDADLEYDPADLTKVVQPILDDKADVVFGSRFSDGPERHVVYQRHRWANRMLTALSNLLTNLDLTDMECGYKAFRCSLLENVQLEETGFGFEPEFTAKIAKKMPRVYEVAVAYQGRSFAEGKKIGWRDGLRAVYAIFKYNVGS